jgi:hypothetical protein
MPAWVAMHRWLKERYRSLDLLGEYFLAVKHTGWDFLWGASVPAIVFCVWCFFEIPPWRVTSLCLMGLIFISGYYLWRADHVRLLPRFAAVDFVRNDARTVDGHYSSYFQVLPKCLTAASIEECVGFLTSIEMQDAKSGEWRIVEDEVLPLEWSFGGDAAAHLPGTLYSGGAERRLNVFFINSVERRIRPCVYPVPVRVLEMFDTLLLINTRAIKFNLLIKGKDCADVRLAMVLNRTPGDVMNPAVTLEPAGEDKDGN